MSYRIEKDTMGEVKVPSDKYWGAQTERSRNNFKIGDSASMPLQLIYGFAYLKKAAAHTNCELGVLTSEKRDLISQVCDEILEGKHDDQFPLVVWQTGSGTQSNMNTNEVIANRAQVISGGSLTDEIKKIHPKVDIVFSGVSITTERNTKVAFPGVYYKSGKSILTKNRLKYIQSYIKIKIHYFYVIILYHIFIL